MHPCACFVKDQVGITFYGKERSFVMFGPLFGSLYQSLIVVCVFIKDMLLLKKDDIIN